MANSGNSEVITLFKLDYFKQLFLNQSSTKFFFKGIQE
jgi:hypothetical protein